MTNSIPRPSAAVPENVICIDMGTTNTRAWLLRAGEVIAAERAGAGVRDTAREGSPEKIRAALRQMVARLGAEAAPPASCIVACGMIGSPSGLAEIPHVPAPAGLDELAAAARWTEIPEVSSIPLLLIPGVRTAGPAVCGSSDSTGSAETRPDLAAQIRAIAEGDVMRGEETLCAGLVALGAIELPASLLHLGSHWKAIQLDAAGRVSSSRTSLSGELLHAAQTQTVLASALPPIRPEGLQEEWVRAGVEEQRRSGLNRALFCARLLELARCGAAEQRLSFIAGVFIGAELHSLLAQQILRRASPVVIAAAGALGEAWRAVLQAEGIPASVLTAQQSETALLAGMRAVLSHAGSPAAPAKGQAL